MRVSGAAFLALVWLVAVACGVGDSADTAAGRDPAPATARSSGAMPLVAVTLRDDGHLDVHVRAAPRLRVLAELGRAADFSILPGRGAPGARNLDLALQGVSLERAIAAVMEGVPYHLHYERDEGEEGGPVSLRRVTVGLLPPPELLSERRVRFLERMRERQDDRRTRSPEEIARLRAEQARAVAARREEIAAKRDAVDPAERARAASLMSPDEDLEPLLAYLHADPDPDVRARAADSLADVEPGPDAFRVVGALLEALDDPEPGVVAAAVEALEDVHDVVPDPSIREAVRALADDEDEGVRAAVESFEDWVSSP